MRQAITKAVAWWVNLALRVLEHTSGQPAVRARLGQLYTVMRDSAAENDARRARLRYDIHATASWAHDTLLSGEGNISIGEGTYIGRDCFIMSQPREAQINIGRHCAISHNVHVRTGSYKTDGEFDYDAENALTWADVTIGDRVWIAAHVVVTGGVTIGDNSVIGANSVVTHDVPPNSIYGGVPAKLIRYKDVAETVGGAANSAASAKTTA
jgi:maltose O-acetyltransferase